MKIAISLQSEHSFEKSHLAASDQAGQERRQARRASRPASERKKVASRAKSMKIAIALQRSTVFQSQAGRAQAAARADLGAKRVPQVVEVQEDPRHLVRTFR